MGIVLNEFRDGFLFFFGGLGGRFSGFLGLQNRLEHEAIFSDITDPEKWIW